MEVQNKNLWSARAQTPRAAEHQHLLQEAFLDVPRSHSTELSRSTSAIPTLVVLPGNVSVSPSGL